jgi:MYXO-CTERM domain-containing protein
VAAFLASMALRLHNRASMRRVLALAALAAPALALGQVNAGAGQVVEIDNFNAVTGGVSYINKAQCEDAAPLRLEWNTTFVSGASFNNAGTYTIFASNTAPTQDATTGARLCAEANDDSTTPDTFAGQIEAVPDSTVVQQEDVSGLTAAQKANRACDATGELQDVFICVHWSDGTTNNRGFATGTFKVQVAAPAAPTLVNVRSGNARLLVSWTASTGGSATADRYFAQATPVGGGTAVASPTTNGTSVTITGLENGTDYDVVVFALSVGGNPSTASDPEVGTPQPTDGFWESYRQRPGAREDGGCATGSAGPLALLGVLGLLAALRRRK